MARYGRQTLGLIQLYFEENQNKSRWAEMPEPIGSDVPVSSGYFDLMGIGKEDT